MAIVSNFNFSIFSLDFLSFQLILLEKLQKYDKSKNRVKKNEHIFIEIPKWFDFLVFRLLNLLFHLSLYPNQKKNLYFDEANIIMYLPNYEQKNR